MFIELHDTAGNITLLCVEDIQRVRKGAHGGSDVFMNELDGWVQVAESVAAVRDLIVKAGDSVTASQLSRTAANRSGSSQLRRRAIGIKRIPLASQPRGRGICRPAMLL